MDKILENTFKVRSVFWRQSIVYGIVASIPATIDVSSVYLLTEFAGIYYINSVIIAFTIALFINYFFQKNLTFKNGSKKYIPQLSIFCLVSLIGLALSVVVVFGAVEYFGLWYMFGKVVAMAMTYVWNFSANRYITFGKFQ